MTATILSVLPLMIPPSFVVALLDVEPSATDPWARVLELGIGGVVVFLVTAPLMRWVLKRLDAQHKQNEKLLETLSAAVRSGQHESRLHERVLEELLTELKAMRAEMHSLPERVANHLRTNGGPK